MSGAWIGLGTLIAATLLGLLWRSRQGRVRTTHRNHRSVPAEGTPAEGTPAEGTPAEGTENAPAAALPEPVLRQVDGTAAVTLLQLSTPICARCPQAHALLAELAAQIPGVWQAELDLATHPELAEQLRVRSTPTILAITRTGHELFRVTGVPRRAELLQALRPHL